MARCLDVANATAASVRLRQFVTASNLHALLSGENLHENETDCEILSAPCCVSSCGANVCDDYCCVVILSDVCCDFCVKNGSENCCACAETKNVFDAVLSATESANLNLNR